MILNWLLKKYDLKLLTIEEILSKTMTFWRNMILNYWLEEIWSKTVTIEEIWSKTIDLKKYDLKLWLLKKYDLKQLTWRNMI